MGLYYSMIVWPFQKLNIMNEVLSGTIGVINNEMNLHNNTCIWDIEYIQSALDEREFQST